VLLRPRRYGDIEASCALTTDVLESCGLQRLLHVMPFYDSCSVSQAGRQPAHATRLYTPSAHLEGSII